MNEKSNPKDLVSVIIKSILIRKWRAEHCAGVYKYSFDQFILVELVGIYPGILASEIAKFFGMTQSSVADLMEALLADGIIRKQGSKGDERAQPLFLTDKAVETVAAMRKIYIESSVYPHTDSACLLENASDIMPIACLLYTSPSPRD